MAGIRAEAWERVLDCKREFQCLKCDIAMLLQEAENMLTSMSIPLLRLTGLKDEELKQQGRLFSTLPVVAEPGKDSIAEESFDKTFESPSSAECLLQNAAVTNQPQGSEEALAKPLRYMSNLLMSTDLAPQLERLQEKAAEFLGNVDKRRRYQLRELADAVDRLEGSIQSAERHLFAKMAKQEGQIGPLIDNFCRKVRDVDKTVQDSRTRRCSPADELHLLKENYRALLSLTARLLPNILDIVTANYASLTVDMKETVESVRNCIRMPLLFVTERLKAQAVIMQVPELELFVDGLLLDARTSMSAFGESNQQFLAHIRRLEACCIEDQEQIELMRQQLVILRESSHDERHQEELRAVKSSHERQVDELSLCMHVLEDLVEDQARELQENKDANRSLEALTQDQAEELLKKKETVRCLEDLVQVQAQDLLEKEDSIRSIEAKLLAELSLKEEVEKKYIRIAARAQELLEEEDSIRSVEAQLRAERSLKEEVEKKYLSMANGTLDLKAELSELQQSKLKEDGRHQLMIEERDAEIERLLLALKTKEREIVKLEMKTSREAAICAKQISHIQSQLTTDTVEKQGIQNELIHLKQEQSEKRRRLRNRASQTVECTTLTPENLGAMKMSQTFSYMFKPNKRMPFTKLLEEQVHGSK